MDWKKGLTNMFLVSRLKGFFKLIFIWIPQTILLGGLVSVTGMLESTFWLILIFLIAPLNFYIFSIYLHDKYVVGNEWAEEEFDKNQIERPSEPSVFEGLGSWFGSVIGIVLLIAVYIFIIGGVIGLAYFGWQQLL